MPVADPDFELRRGPESILLPQAAFLPSVISSFFTQNKKSCQGRGAGPPRSVTGCIRIYFIVSASVIRIVNNVLGTSLLCNLAFLNCCTLAKQHGTV